LNYFRKENIEQKAGILWDVPRTKYPNKYFEGLYFWFDQDGETQTSLEYHEECGGDPEVFWAAMSDEIIKKII